MIFDNKIVVMFEKEFVVVRLTESTYLLKLSPEVFMNSYRPGEDSIMSKIDEARRKTEEVLLEIYENQVVPMFEDKELKILWYELDNLVFAVVHREEE